MHQNKQGRNSKIEDQENSWRGVVKLLVRARFILDVTGPLIGIGLIFLKNIKK